MSRKIEVWVIIHTGFFWYHAANVIFKCVHLGCQVSFDSVMAVHPEEFAHDLHCVMFCCGLVLADLNHIVQDWASCQKTEFAGCACAGNAGNVFPATDFIRNRQLAIPECITARAPRTCHDACRDR